MPQPERLAIVADSATDVPEHLAHELRLDGVIPTMIAFGEESFRYPLDITMDEFLNKLASSSKSPTTGAASPREYSQIYEKIESDKILSIHVSSKLSGVFNSAVLASQENQKVVPYDSELVSIAAGFLVIKALEMRNDGQSMEQITEELDRLKDRIVAYAIPETLEQLRKSGRVSNLKAMLGEATGILPVIKIARGYFQAEAKVRKPLVNKQLVTYVKELSEQNGGIEQLAVFHSGAEEKARRLASELNIYSEKPIMLAELSPVISAHCGLGTVGIVAIANQPIN